MFLVCEVAYYAIEVSEAVDDVPSHTLNDVSLPLFPASNSSIPVYPIRDQSARPVQPAEAQRHLPADVL